MRSTSVISALFVATSVVASLVPKVTRREPEQFVPLWEEQLQGGGVLEYLGPDPTTTTPTRSLNVPRKACSSNPQPSCDTSHAANNELCSELVDSLYATSRNTVQKSPRQVCYKENDSFCCSSWSDAVNSLTQGDLADNANAILKQCTINGISGQINGVNLGGVCLDQCLSDRGKGCT